MPRSEELPGGGDDVAEGVALVALDGLDQFAQGFLDRLVDLGAVGIEALDLVVEVRVFGQHQEGARGLAVEGGGGAGLEF